jgi:hypothetical protein
MCCLCGISDPFAVVRAVYSSLEPVVCCFRGTVLFDVAGVASSHAVVGRGAKNNPCVDLVSLAVVNVLC